MPISAILYILFDFVFYKKLNKIRNMQVIYDNLWLISYKPLDWGYVLLILIIP